MKLRLWMVFVLFTLAVMTRAQDSREITGTVSDISGEPLIGATVKPVGEGTGTVTDLDGNFRLKVGKSVQKLIISYVGYEDNTAII